MPGGVDFDSDSDSDNEYGSDFDWEQIKSEELGKIRDFIQETVRSLLRLSMTIENPAPRDRYLTARSTDVTHFEGYDIENVRSKLPNAPRYIVDRLGRANSCRRQFLKYSEGHRVRLKAGLSEEVGQHIHGDHQSTIASSLPDAMKVEPPILLTSPEKDDAVSITSVATSAPESQGLKVPHFPESATYDEEFECPLCYCIICISGWDRWK
jgi:hypothetical protein